VTIPKILINCALEPKPDITSRTRDLRTAIEHFEFDYESERHDRWVQDNTGKRLLDIDMSDYRWPELNSKMIPQTTPQLTNPRSCDDEKGVHS
jgi:hypothetical protein